MLALISTFTLFLALDSLTFALKVHLEGSSGLKDIALRNSLMMCVYLTTECMDYLENESTQPTAEQAVSGRLKVSTAKLYYWAFSHLNLNVVLQG